MNAHNMVQKHDLLMPASYTLIDICSHLQQAKRRQGKKQNENEIAAYVLSLLLT
jgi:hypothetical protein